MTWKHCWTGPVSWPCGLHVYLLQDTARSLKYFSPLRPLNFYSFPAGGSATLWALPQTVEHPKVVNIVALACLGPLPDDPMAPCKGWGALRLRGSLEFATMPLMAHGGLPCITLRLCVPSPPSPPVARGLVLFSVVPSSETLSLRALAPYFGFPFAHCLRPSRRAPGGSGACRSFLCLPLVSMWGVLWHGA
jgi:hypothetical protein